MNDIAPVPAAPKPLTIICRSCGGEGRKIRSRYGGNDPDTWDAGPCEPCEETGYETIRCDGWRCESDAVEMFLGMALCAACVTVERENALVVGEEYVA